MEGEQYIDTAMESQASQQAAPGAVAESSMDSELTALFNKNLQARLEKPASFSSLMMGGFLTGANKKAIMKKAG